jgi:VIT1/CCC1 family predicted Fe2+/Mn2+ transporter
MPAYLTTLGQAAPALAMLAALLLIGFGIALIRRRPSRIKGVLMLVMAVVLVVNVAIWTA